MRSILAFLIIFVACYIVWLTWVWIRRTRKKKKNINIYFKEMEKDDDLKELKP